MLLKLKIKSNKIPNNPYGILHGAFPTTHLSIPIHTHTHREFRQQYMLSQAQTNLLHNSVNKNMYHESNKRKNVHHKMILPRKVHMFRFKFRNSKKKRYTQFHSFCIGLRANTHTSPHTRKTIRKSHSHSLRWTTHTYSWAKTHSAMLIRFYGHTNTNTNTYGNAQCFGRIP